MGSSGQGYGGAVRVPEEGQRGGGGGFLRHRLCGGVRDGGLRLGEGTLQDDLPQFVDLNAPQVRQLSLALVVIDERVQRQLALQEGVSHDLCHQKQAKSQTNVITIVCNYPWCDDLHSGTA